MFCSLVFDYWDYLLLCDKIISMRVLIFVVNILNTIAINILRQHSLLMIKNTKILFPFIRRLPWDGFRVKQILDRVLIHDSRPPIFENDNMHPAVSAVIKRCWARDPKQRPTFRELDRELSSFPRKLGVEIDGDGEEFVANRA